MKITTLLAIAASALLVAATVSADQSAQFSTSSANGDVTISPPSGYHLNTDYPNWSLKVGDKKLVKADFTTLTESVAKVHAPKGTAHLKGAICAAGPQGGCTPVAQDIEVK